MAQDFILIAFKGNRKEVFINPIEINLAIGDSVIIEADKGEDLGTVVQMGRLVSLKTSNSDPQNILRKASSKEIELLHQNREKEVAAYFVCRNKIKTFDINMKLVDVEYQFDHNKLTFYFTSDRRVDFRKLVKDLAAKYRTRIELRQIGVRDEAKRIGGFGVCGQQLCCSSHLNDFEPISTQHVKDQMLPMNPIKLSGNCGRLKCCLAYEREQYISSLKLFPGLEQNVKTPAGDGYVSKIDIFKNSVMVKIKNDNMDDSFETFDIKEISIIDNNLRECCHHQMAEVVL